MPHIAFFIYELESAFDPGFSLLPPWLWFAFAEDAGSLLPNREDCVNVGCAIAGVGVETGLLTDFFRSADFFGEAFFATLFLAAPFLGAALRAEDFLAAFFADFFAPFLADFFAATFFAPFLADFFAPFFADFLPAFLADFFAAFFAFFAIAYFVFKGLLRVVFFKVPGELKFTSTNLINCCYCCA